MADDNRYGGAFGQGGGGFDRDRDRNDDYRGYGSGPGGGGFNDASRGGSYGAFGQGGGYAGSPAQGGYGQQDRQPAAGHRDNARFGNDDERRGVAIDETDRLIASNKVEGTAVYDRRGNRLGSVYNFMVDKRSGRVAYAVLSFGGFLGLGARHYPLPWSQLTYEERHGGYVVDISERDLDRAPSHRAGDVSFDGRYSAAIDSYYGGRY
jgi:sporulation protein YlmC with PRC-barrel domain